MKLSISFSSKTVCFVIACLVCLSGLQPVTGTAAAAGHKKDISGYLIAVLPIDNLSGTRAPVKDIRQLMLKQLTVRGGRVLDDSALEGFMAARRMRYTGAMDLETSRMFSRETPVDAVLITSLELYDEIYPPKIALISRLVSVGEKPEVLWTDGIGLSGDDSPGILGLGLINEQGLLLEKAVRHLMVSLEDSLSAASEGVASGHWLSGWGRYGPKTFYRSPVLSPETKYTIAIMPFLNRSERKYAGDIMVLHFLRQLKGSGRFNVIEPGIVRDDLLGFRIIMNEGISFADASLIFSTIEADADLILSGTVIDYQDYHGPEGAPKVDFSVQVIERKSAEVVWTSKSYNTGNEGVYFFDMGRINTAHTLASGMAEAVAGMMTAGPGN
ncbi:MAG: hypothetical protein OEU95_01085 [Nitrospirota bacterium]|nr:hypothetical protein [Nitrospirota bacterium]